MEANVRLLQRSLERGRIATKQAGAGIQDAGPGLFARQFVDDRGRLLQRRPPRHRQGTLASGGLPSNAS